MSQTELEAMVAAPTLTVSEAAREILANPRDITRLFYDRKLRDDICPIVRGRRQIPRSYLDEIRAALRRAGCQVGAEEVATHAR
jgi:hypothetical protein